MVSSVARHCHQLMLTFAVTLCHSDLGGAAAARSREPGALNATSAM